MMISGKFESLLKTADSICVLTGAGISAESGVATFRGTDGLWSKLKPEELANFDAFLRNPDIVWEWYNHRKQIIQEVKPNAAHYALADMEQLVKDFTLTTQNIDNLHTRAGSKRVLELHGNIERSYCVTCGKFVPDVVVTREQRIPHCDDCGGVIRPDVVWFGEMLPQDVLEESMSAAARCSLFLTIGTSAVVYPAAGLPLKARDCGAYVVEINLERTEISHLVDESLIGKAGEILPQLAEIMKTSRSQK
jgi:NAD-dependent deacetylase